MADWRDHYEARQWLTDACWSFMGLGEDDAHIRDMFEACLKEVREDFNASAKHEASFGTPQRVTIPNPNIPGVDTLHGPSVRVAISCAGPRHCVRPGCKHDA